MGLKIEPYIVLMLKMSLIAFVHTGYKTQNAKQYE
jgi:hypothetical protein